MITTPTSSFLIVAVSFNDQTESLLRSAASLARVKGCSLMLLHVCEPPLQAFWGELPIDAAVSSQLSRSLYEEPYENAKFKLSELGESLGEGVHWKAGVLIGDPVSCISRSSQDPNAIGVMVGTSHDATTPAWQQGYSVALGLVSELTKPLMIVPSGCMPQFDHSGMQVVVADDLTEDGERMMQDGLGFCREFSHAHLTSLTVLPLSENYMRHNVEMALSAVPQCAQDPATVGGVMEVVMTKTRERLVKRASDALGEGRDPFVEMRAKVAFGEPGKFIHTVLKELSPDMAIFGRHRTFHWKSFSFGQIPSKLLLAGECPLLIIPQ